MGARSGRAKDGEVVEEERERGEVVVLAHDDMMRRNGHAVAP